VQYKLSVFLDPELLKLSYKFTTSKAYLLNAVQKDVEQLAKFITVNNYCSKTFQPGTYR